MIKTFRNKGLKAFAETGSTRKLSVQNPKRLKLILAALEASRKPSEMNQPGLRFHSLAPGQPGRYAVDASGNWRVTFAFDGPDAIEVDLEDYH